MKKVKILSTGEIRTVTPNVAFDLIDSKKAKLYTEREMWKDRKREEVKKRRYEDRKMRVSRRSFAKRSK